MSTRRFDNEAWQRRKEYLIRSLFQDSPDLSTIREEGDESSTAVSRTPSPSLEPYRSYSSRPPPAHSDRPYSPLPPLTIQIVKKPNKHDEPEEFYQRLRKKIIKIYNRIFFEDRSDISDINTSDEDDEAPINNETYDLSSSVEIVESIREFVTQEPLDLSIKHDKSVDTTHQYVNDDLSALNTNNIELGKATQHTESDTATQADNTDNKTASTEKQQENEAIELEFNEPSDKKSLDDNDNNNNEDLSNPEANIDSTEGGQSNKDDIPNLDANIESDVSSSTDIAFSSESDGNRDSVTPLSSTVQLSATSDEEVDLEINKVPANVTYDIEAEDVEMEGTASERRPSTASKQRVEEEEVDMEPLHDNNNTVREEAATPKNNENTANEEISDNETIDTDPDNPESDVEEMRTHRPHHSTGSLTNIHMAHPIEPNILVVEHQALMDSDNTEEVMHTGPNNDIENPERLFDLIRISSPKEMTTESHTKEETNTRQDNATENAEAKIVDHEASIESHIDEEDIRTRPSNAIENLERLDLFDLIRMSPKEMNTEVDPSSQSYRHVVNPIEQNIFVVEHHASMESDTIEEDMQRRPSNDIENPDRPKEQMFSRLSNGIERLAFDSVRTSSPNVQNIDNNSIEENYGKRKSDNPGCGKEKRVKLAEKGVQTDISIGEVIQNININIKPAEKSVQTDNIMSQIIQNIKINIV